MQGYVYFLTNPAMPGLLKIGFTRTSLTQRLRELDTTSIPEGFIVVASFFVSDPQACERAIHERLAEFRACKEREFFRISPAQALTAVVDVASSFLHDSHLPHSNPASPSLDELDESVLQLILHAENGSTYPQQVARKFDIHREEAHLRLGELAAKGYLRERHEDFSLTHKGRKYVFDRGLVIREALPDVP